MSKTKISKSLIQLAAEINSEHQKGVEALKVAVLHFRAAGKSLREAKQQVPHGEWQSWLKKNFKGSPETAQVYMKVDRNWDKRLAGAVDSGEVVSLRDALTLIGRPAEEVKEAPVKFRLGDVLRPLQLVKVG